MRFRSVRPKLLALGLALTVLTAVALAQGDDQTHPQEQTVFSADTIPGQQQVSKPVEVPDAALQVLRDTLSRSAINCIKNVNQFTPDQVSASWFVGSEIHLNGPEELDLIVQPKDMQQSPSPNRCLFGAHVVPFWVLRNKDGRYTMLLETYADALQVLNSRTNWYRDIQTFSTTATTHTSILYKMDVAQYQTSERKTDH